jgi:AAA ATPase domain
MIIERALAKEKTLRYSSAHEMADALRSLRSSITGTWSGIPIVYDPDLIDRSAPSFVGRESEIQKLEDLLQQAIEGTGRMVFITGEPGIGKTSLSGEFLRRARKQQLGIVISRGRCIEQYGTGEAYWPFLDAMGELLQSPGRERIAAIMQARHPWSFCWKICTGPMHFPLTSILGLAPQALCCRPLRGLGS